MKIVYFSPNDTTRTVTEAAAAAMEPGGERVDLLKAPLTEDLSVGAEEIRVDKPRYRACLPYTAIAGAYEDNNVFLFSLGAGMSFFLPKRCLTGEECLQIRDYLSSALQKKFQQEGPQSNG